MKNRSYLCEREFGTEKIKENFERREKWERIFGKSGLCRLEKRDRKIERWIEGSDGTCKKSIQSMKIEKEWREISFREEAKYSVSKDFFDNFYKVYLAIAEKRLQKYEELTDIWSEAVWEAFRKNLLGKLQKISGFCLIEKMKELKEKGKLLGETSKEEYSYFEEKHLSDLKFHRRLFDEYPVLGRCIEEKINQHIEVWIEVTEKIRQDKEKIIKEFCDGNKFEILKNIEGELSDSHFDGRGVFVITLENGYKIVYKNRSLLNEKLFYRFLQSADSMMWEKTPKIISRKTYGWMEYIEERECIVSSEVKKYYFRVGELLFWTWVLAVRDIHMGNWIAHGEYPVIIDIEVWGDNIIMEQQPEEKKILSDSVLGTNILSIFQWNGEGKGVDFSAIRGRGGQSIPIKVMKLFRKGTSEMFLGYIDGISENERNLLYYRGKIVNPGDYRNEIIQGFKKSFKDCLENIQKGQKLEQVDTRCFRRILYEHTQIYQMLINASYQEQLMRDGAEREIFLNTLYLKNRRMQWKTEEEEKEEIQCLLRGDIPYFKRPHENIIQMEKLSMEQLELQIRIILITLEFMKKNSKEMKNNFWRLTNRIGKKDRRYEIIEKIGDQLYHQAIYGEKRRLLGWLGVNIMGRDEIKWEINITNKYFYGGIAGIWFFLIVAYKKLHITKYRELVEEMEEIFENYTNNGKKGGAGGMYEGEMSIIYTYLLVFEALGEEKYLQMAERHYKAVREGLKVASETDIIYGKAGQIVVMSKLYQHRADDRILRDIERVIENLLAEIKEGSKRIVKGVAHGNSGIIIALTWAWKLMKRKEYIVAIEKLLLEEEKSFEGTAMEDDVTWCNGIAGILLTRIRIKEIIKEQKITQIIDKDIEKISSIILNYPLKKALSICHGSVGNIYILGEYAEKIKDESLGILCKKYGAEVYERYMQNIKLLLQEEKTPGIMSGIAGIGYLAEWELMPDLPFVI